jgi:hypothetical protein
MARAMESHGEYDRHSQYQLNASRGYPELVRRAAEAATGATEGHALLVDYGAAQGRVSTPLIREAVEAVREHDRELPVFVCHNDQPSNDWAGLFDRLRTEASYLDVPGGPITPMASATSFYEPVVPRGTATLGISFAAAQWLGSPGPTDGGTALYFDQLEGAARDRMAEQAHHDWVRFLSLRADELADGGRLVLDMMGVGHDGVAAGHELWQRIRAICEELVAEGRLDADRLEAYVIPVYERTVAEALRPFDEELSGRLTLEGHDLREVPDPFTEQYRQDGDAEAFADTFAAFVRAFAAPSLREGLGLGPEVVDDVFDRLRQGLVPDAATFRFDVRPLVVVARAGS